jgi:hypothetical protein
LLLVMREAGIGRVLVASLHQGIADILPMRLDFYENWLTMEGLREGTIGVAPLLAVLSFLRQEGEVYHVITTRAGEYAAEWTVQGMAPPHRAIMCSMPEWLRHRLVLRLAGRVVHSSYPGSRAILRIRQGTADVEVRASIFCTVREPVRQPLCGFYASTLTRLFRLFDLRGQAEVVTCRATGGSTCMLKVGLVGQHEAGETIDAQDAPVVQSGLSA